MITCYLDTNVLVRYFTHDVDFQFEKARSFITQVEQETVQGIVLLLVVNELIWVLDNFYHIDRTVYIPQLMSVLALSGITIPECKKDHLLTVLSFLESCSYDFTDVYLAFTAPKNSIFSFDRDLAKIAQKM